MSTSTQSKSTSRMLYVPGVMGWLRYRGRMALAEQAALKAERGCKFCGQEPVCPHCNRCYNPNCNVGCIFCRVFPPEPEKCGCCGQTIRR